MASNATQEQSQRTAAGIVMLLAQGQQEDAKALFTLYVRDARVAGVSQIDALTALNGSLMGLCVHLVGENLEGLHDLAHAMAERS